MFTSSLGARYTSKQGDASRDSLDGGVDVDPELTSATGVTTLVVRLPELASEDTTPGTLKEHAAETQRPVVEQLERTGPVSVQNQFWLTNAIVVDADLDQIPIAQIAAIDSVTEIHANATLELEGQPPGSRASARLQDSSTDTEADGDSSVETESDTEDATWNVERVDAPEAWAEYDTKGEGVKVAVLDTGIEADHDDLDLYTTDPNDPTYPGGWAVIDSSGNVVDDPDPPFDDHGHGTKISGLVAAGDESGEYVGVAPNADLLHAQIAESGSASFTRIVGGLEWAVANDAGAASISFGGDGYYSYLIDPIRNAESSGTLVVASIGNGGAGTSTTPGNEYDSIGVGSTDRWDDVSSFSGGETIDTDEAWGNDAPEDWPDEYTVPRLVVPAEQVLTTHRDNSHGASSGTSAAAPQVAGAIAVLTSATDGDHTPEQIKTALAETAAHPAGEDAQDYRYGHGIVDVPAAIEYLDQQERAEFEVSDASLADETILAGETAAVTATVENVGESEGQFTAEFNLTDSEGETTTHDTNTVELDVGESTTVTLEDALDEAGTYDADVSEEPAGTLSVEQPAVFDLSGGTLSDDEIEEGDSVVVSAQVENTGDHEGTFTAELYADDIQEQTTDVTVAPNGSESVSFTYQPTETGEYDVEVAGDDNDGSETATFAGTLAVLEPAEFDLQNPAISDTTILEGEEITASVTVENTGEVEETFTAALEITADGTTEIWNTTDVTLDGGETTDVSFDEQFDDPGEYDVAISGAHAGTLVVEEAIAEFVTDEVTLSEETILEGDSVLVTATVENVGDATGDHDATLYVDTVWKASETVTLEPNESTTVNFEETFEDAGTYEITVDDGAPVTLTVEQPATFTIVDTWMESDVIETGESVVTLAEISNEGDREGIFSAELIVEEKGVVATADVKIAAGEMETVSLEYTVEEAGAYDIYVNQTFVGELLVEEPPEFDVDVVLPEEPVDTDESVAIDVTVENVGGSTGTKTIEVTIDDEDPETDEVELDPGESETLTFYQTFDEPGEYVVAVNGSKYGTIDVVEASGDFLEHQWSYENGARAQYSTPAVEGALVFVGGLGESITALSRDDGSVAWEFARDGSLSDSSPAVHDGTVYVGSGGGTLYALDAETGERAWEHQSESAIVSSPTIADGTVYVGTNDGRVLALDAAGGDLEWTKSVDSAIYSTPAVDDGLVYVTTAEGTLVVVDSVTGTYYWSFDIGAASKKASPTVADGTVYVAGDTVYAFDASSKQSKLWEQSVGETMLSTPAVDKGTVYLGSGDEAIYALDATDGSIVWDQQTDEAVVGKPAVPDGNVVTGTLNGTTLLLDGETGEVYEEKALGEAVYASPAVAGDEVYLGTHHGQYVVLANVS